MNQQVEMVVYARERFVSAVYAVTTDPTQADTLFEAWEDFILAQKQSGALNLSDAELVHFNQAMQIFAVLGRRHKMRERNEEVLARLPAPACLCDGAGRILAQNEPALAAFGTLETIGGLSCTEVFARATGALRTGSDMEIFALAETQGTDATALVMRAPEFDTTEPRFIVSLGAHAVAPATLERLALRFGLTQSEREVLGHLLSARTADAISALRGVSLPTTRSQIQSILGKTGASSQLALVRQCLLLGQQMAFLELARDVGTIGGVASRHASTDITLRDGRRMRFFDMGDRHGRPVLLLHALIGEANKAQGADAKAKAKAALLGALQRLGLGLQDPADWFGSGGDHPEIDALVAEREAARKAKDWARADAIRDQLNGLGVTCEDGPHGPTWRFK